MDFHRYIACLLLPLSAAGCAGLSSRGDNDVPRVLTQRSPDDMAACIGAAVGVAPVSTEEGITIQLPGQQAGHIVIVRDKLQTVVNMNVAYGSESKIGEAAAIRCGLVQSKS